MDAGCVLDYANTERFAAEKYRGRLWMHERTMWQHAWETAAAAEKLLGDQLAKNWGQCPPPTITSQIEQIKHAGMLHAVMDRCAVNFEEVCQVTHLEVAKIISGYSADPRLPEPVRVLDRIGRLADGPLLSQVLMLADVLCAVRYYETYLKDAPYGDVPAIAHDLEIRRKYLSPLRHVVDSKLLHGWMRRGYAIIDESLARCNVVTREHNAQRRLVKRRQADAQEVLNTCRKRKI